MSSNFSIGLNVEPEFKIIFENIPEEIRKIQGILELDPFELANKYFAASNVADISIDPNANMSGKSPVNFHSEIFKPQLKVRSFYELWKRLKAKYGSDEACKVITAMLDGTLYFHDVTKIDIPYCFAFDTSFLSTQGRPYGWLPGKAPTRSSSFIGQLIETTMDWSQQLAGAVGVANTLVNLAFYTRRERAEMMNQLRKVDGFENRITALKMYIGGLGYLDSKFVEVEFDLEGTIDEISKQLIKEKGMSVSEATDMIANAVYDKYIENLLQQFVHTMHNTFRIGGDSPFTNWSIFDKYIFRNVFDKAVYPDMSKTIDNEEEVMHVQKIYVDFFVKGSPITGKKYRFPVSSINIKKFTKEDAEAGICDESQVGRIADYEFFKYIVGKNLPRGTFNMHVGEKVATCCRLTSDLAELKDQIRVDSFGNGGMSIGSHRVVAVNQHRVALLAKDSGAPYIDILKKILKLAEEALIIHKELLKERVDAGFLQFFNIGWCDLKMFFSTIGYTGLWDAYEVINGVDGTQQLDDYLEWAGEVLDVMDQYAKDAGKNNKGYAFNVEEIPAENASPKLAMMDNYLWRNVSGYKNIELLANQMVPLYREVPLFDRLRVQGALMNKVSGGAILHLNLTDKLTPGANEEFHRIMIEDYNIPHYAINVGSTTCVNGHTIPGIHATCPECGGEIDTYTLRVVGFDTDTKDWIKQRRNWEMPKRQFYTTQNILNK